MTMEEKYHMANKVEWGIWRFTCVFWYSREAVRMRSKAAQRTAMQFRHASASPLGNISVTGFGVRQSRALEEPRIFGQYALMYVLQGEGEYRDANGWEQRLSPGDLVLVFPELSHLYNPLPNTQWVCTFLCFQGPVFDLLRGPGGLDSRKPIYHLEPVDEWSRRIEEVLGAAREIGQQPPLVEVTRLLELLAKIVSDPGGTLLIREDRRWAARACGLLEAHLTERLDWAGLAHGFGLTVEGFRKRFARLVGQPPARYRMGRLIDRACELICEGRHTDSQIADLLGFCDEFYFSRRFKEITGKSPRMFRKSFAPRSSETKAGAPRRRSG